MVCYLFLNFSTGVGQLIQPSSLTPAGKYCYGAHLMQLEACKPECRGVPPRLLPVITPLEWETWARALQLHPDRDFVAYIVGGLRDGFRVGFNYASHGCVSAKRNMLSASQHPEVIDAYLEEECTQGRIIGPLDTQEAEGVHISRFGVIPKPHKPGCWRLILDLSHPEGASVNDGIDQALSSLSYVSVDDIVDSILSLGQGALLAKIDVRSAYRVVPVHPEDRMLLGMCWKGKVYVDATLPFGLRSAPKIFTAVADALEWILRLRGVRNVKHYLDDFIVVGPPRSLECKENLDTMRCTCRELNLPLAEEKSVGPATLLDFLGIELDTVQMEIRLPEGKLVRTKELVASWRGRKSCRVRELQSLVGSLQHACKVVHPGRTFMRRMHELLSRAKRGSDYLRLNKDFRADVEWWHAFLSSWNGVSMLRRVRVDSPDGEFWSDASGSWGCGAFWGGLWLQLQWVPGSRLALASIAAKEFLPILLASIVWGELWQGCTIRCNCDNEAIVQVINGRYARDPLLAHMLRCLFFICARHQFSIVAKHTSRKDNVAADAISRNNMQMFYLQVPNASSSPTPVPPLAVIALTSSQIDWLSQDWTNLFSFILSRP